MVEEIFLQNWIFTKFALPFLLIFFIVFAILEKTKILGDNKQISALVAFVIGLIFVGVAYPKDIVNNLILFLTVALVVVFVIMLLWGFASGEEKGLHLEGWMRNVLWGVLGIAVVLALIWATGADTRVFDVLFQQSWSKTLWTNILFVVAIAAAIAIVLKK
ncbi:hypothetical protein COU59_03820 [Candidatus Pacearchaeota archaeon CG10_big_fil_rev_8_21_14_0_10_34_12]|nr:MAG: hypothetical protein COU59_03820 [Candidatus Pacearchaeota archaeon CG10_big_fil_rev_8_21_14_0_10_34_12]